MLMERLSEIGTLITLFVMYIIHEFGYVDANIFKLFAWASILIFGTLLLRQYYHSKGNK